MVSEFFLKWFLGIITGVLGSILVTGRKKIKDFLKFQKKKKDKMLLKGVNKDIHDLAEELEQVEDEIENQDQIFVAMLKEFKEELMSIITPMREALLSSHYEALLAKCKKYIQAGEISFDELELLEKDYQTYSALGGNGHMETWMLRVRQLKII